MLINVFCMKVKADDEKWPDSGGFWEIELTNSEITDGKGNLKVNGKKNMYVLSIDAGFFF